MSVDNRQCQTSLPRMVVFATWLLGSNEDRSRKRSFVFESQLILAPLLATMTTYIPVLLLLACSTTAIENAVVNENVWGAKPNAPSHELPGRRSVPSNIQLAGGFYAVENLPAVAALGGPPPSILPPVPTIALVPETGQKVPPPQPNVISGGEGLQAGLQEGLKGVSPIPQAAEPEPLQPRPLGGPPPINLPNLSPAPDAGKGVLPPPASDGSPPVSLPNLNPAPDAGKGVLPPPAAGGPLSINSPNLNPALDAGRGVLPPPVADIPLPINSPNLNPALDAGKGVLPPPAADGSPPISLPNLNPAFDAGRGIPPPPIPDIPAGVKPIEPAFKPVPCPSCPPASTVTQPTTFTSSVTQSTTFTSYRTFSTTEFSTPTPYGPPVDRFPPDFNPPYPPVIPPRPVLTFTTVTVPGGAVVKSTTIVQLIPTTTTKTSTQRVDGHTALTIASWTVTNFVTVPAPPAPTQKFDGWVDWHKESEAEWCDCDSTDN